MPAPIDRRQLLRSSAALALGSVASPVLSQEVPPATPSGIDKTALAHAETLVGIELSDAERELALDGLRGQRESYEALRGIELPNAVAPALRFDPLPPGTAPPRGQSHFQPVPPRAVERPASDDELAFLGISELGALLRQGKVSSLELTRLYLARLRRWDPVLECVVTYTDERALAEAERADRDFAAGIDHGPLHGIPWGAKDLLAAAGAPTTWGSKAYESQSFPEDSTAVARLTRAGAVLVAKLSLGELAWGDVWFRGRTRNPWNPTQGSSGSSAGSASAAAAGLVGFAVGSETWGSIVSPCTRCGATGLRPTFGRVSRHGAMALSWSMDKLGPIARSVADCALVFNFLYGPDGKDNTVVEAPFRWPPGVEVGKLKVGYLRAAFEAGPEEDDDPAEFAEARAFDLAALDVLRSLGFELIPIEAPAIPVAPLSFVLRAEAAAAFDELTRSNRDDLLVRQIANAWPNVFRHARFIPAVEYIQAQRVRTQLIEAMAQTMAKVDLYVVPSFGGNDLLRTNLTGHPAVVLPNGFRKDGTPTSLTFVGRLYEEGTLLAVAQRYQDATTFHHRHPDLEAAKRKREEEAKPAGG